MDALMTLAWVAVVRCRPYKKNTATTRRVRSVTRQSLKFPSR